MQSNLAYGQSFEVLRIVKYCGTVGLAMIFLPKLYGPDLQNYSEIHFPTPLPSQVLTVDVTMGTLCVWFNK